MLRSIQSFIGYTLLATDGECGKVEDVLFDDQIWSTAYLIARIGGIFGKTRVLLPPTALGRPDWRRKAFPVVYSKEQVAQCPQFDRTGVTGPAKFIVEDDPHLRSARDIMRYHVQAIDGKLCQVRDLIVDEFAWMVRFLVVEAGGFHGRKVMLSPTAVKAVLPEDGKLSANVSTRTILESPRYDPSMPVNIEYGPRQSDFYGRPTDLVA